MSKTPAEIWEGSTCGYALACVGGLALFGWVGSGISFGEMCEGLYYFMGAVPVAFILSEMRTPLGRKVVEYRRSQS